MMESEDAWMYYRDDVVEKIDMNVVLKRAENVGGALGVKLDKSWEAYVSELPKFSWISMYLTSLEVEGSGDSTHPIFSNIAKNITISPKEIGLEAKKVCDLPGSNPYKSKAPHSEVFVEMHWGRLLVYLRFAEQLGLTEEEWEQVFHFLIPILLQRVVIQIRVYTQLKKRCRVRSIYH